MDLLRYVKMMDPQQLTGQELAELRGMANNMIKSPNEAAVTAGSVVLHLLNHIDYMTMEGMKK